MSISERSVVMSEERIKFLSDLAIKLGDAIEGQTPLFRPRSLRSPKSYERLGAIKKPTHLGGRHINFADIIVTCPRCAGEVLQSATRCGLCHYYWK